MNHLLFIQSDNLRTEVFIGTNSDPFNNLLLFANQDSLWYFEQFYHEDTSSLFSFNLDEQCPKFWEHLDNSVHLIDETSLSFVSDQASIPVQPVQPVQPLPSSPPPSLFYDAPNDASPTTEAIFAELDHLESMEMLPVSNSIPSSNSSDNSPSSSPRDALQQNLGQSNTLRCLHCNRLFPTRTILRRHAKTHNRPLQCDFPSCHKRFAERRDLNRHRQARHQVAVTQNYYCPISGCDYALNGKFNGFGGRLDNVQRHMRRQHRNDHANRN